MATINDSSASHYLDGTIGDDTIFGNDGDDTLVGEGGNDSLVGGNGDDRYWVKDAGDIVSETGTGYDAVWSEISYTLTANVEELDLLGSANLNGTGNADANYLYGNSGNNVLSGLGGNDTIDATAGGHDTLVGGDGEDTYIINDGSTVITETNTTDWDAVWSSDTYTLAANLEELDLLGTSNIGGFGNSGDNFLYGNSGNNWLEGNGGNDTIYGNAGNDTLVGDGGTDSLIGGDGEDTYWVKDAGDIVVEAVTGDWDAVWSEITYTLTDNVEELDLLGTSNIGGFGNSGDNFLYGNSGNNWLEGNAGNDTIYGNGGNDTLVGDGGTDSLIGGDGEDTYWVKDAGDIVVEAVTGDWDAVWSEISYTLTANVEELDLLGTANLNGTGNSGDNFLYGNSGNNVLNGMSGNDSLLGNAGNDTLQGGGGGDTMWGGSGDDVYYVDNVGDSIYEYTTPGVDDGGYDKVISSISYTLTTYVEELDLIGSANINGTGNSGDNYIYGNSGNNLLSGLAGADTLVGNGGIDTLVGGTGEDLYIVSNSATVITETNAPQWDTVWSSVSYTLSANVEELDLTGSANINATGNTGDNWLFGNSGNNLLSGLAGNDTLVSTNGGNDTLVGGTGDDTYWISNASTVITETNTTDWDAVWSTVSYTLGTNLEELDLISGSGNINGTGNSAANFLYGNEGNNVLSGLNGNDTLTGNAGNDTLIGGSGTDYFAFSAAGAANGLDNVQDFVHGTDQLWFAGSDYGFASGHGLTASEFTAGSSASGTSAQFIWDAASHTLWFDDDGTGSHAAIAIATFGGGATLTASDFHFS